MHYKVSVRAKHLLGFENKSQINKQPTGKTGEKSQAPFPVSFKQKLEQKSVLFRKT